MGKSIAEAMVKEGASVVICDINPEATKDIEAISRSCLGVVCDVSSVENVESMFA